MSRNESKSFAKYIFALLLLGSNGILASMIDLPSNQIVMLRTFIGGIILIGVFLAGRNHFTFFRNPKDFFYMTVSGVATGASWIFLYEAYKQIGVGVASLAYYTGPIIVMALSPIVFRERLNWVKVAGFVTVITGLVLLSFQSLKQGCSVGGMILGILSAFMYALMVIFNKKNRSIRGMESSILTLVVSCLTVTIYTLIRQGFGIHIPHGSIAPMIFLGVVNTGIGCWLYFSSIGELPVQTVSVFGYLEPLSAVVFSVVLLHENMSSVQVFGAVCIIAGALFSEIKPEHLSLRYLKRVYVRK